MKKSIRQVFRSIQKNKKRRFVSPLEQHIWRDDTGIVTVTDSVRLLHVYHDKTPGHPVSQIEQKQFDRVMPRSVDCDLPAQLPDLPMVAEKGVKSVKLGIHHFDRFYLPESMTEWTIRTNRKRFYPAVLFHASGEAVLVVMPLTEEIADKPPVEQLPKLPAVSAREILEDRNTGRCRACGEEAHGVEPDARKYRCEACGEHEVYGLEELVIMGEVEVGE